MGEHILNELSPHGFKHYEQSLRVVDVLEKDGEGLNLTNEVRDGILNHAGTMTASTFEGKIIKYADRFAYLNHDIDDAVRAEIIKNDDLPKEYIKILGGRHSKRINTLITDIINTTLKNKEVSMSAEIEGAMMRLRAFMFDTVYKKIGEMCIRDSGINEEIDMIKMAKISQKAEHNFIGVKCGIMDQFASAMGKKDHAIFLDCKTLDYKYAPINFEGKKLLLTNTNKKHALGASQYNERREECERGLEMLKKAMPEKTCLGEISYDEFIQHKNLITDPIVCLLYTSKACLCTGRAFRA